MTVLAETFSLTNGNAIPKIGFGTWLIDDADAADAVREAIAVGYRHIDTAQAYGNEVGVGKGICRSQIAREDLFVTTKLRAEIKNESEAERAIDGSLTALGLDRIDLLIIHSPQPWTHFREGDYAEGNKAAWRALEAAYEDGRVSAIGVSNFLETDLEPLMASANVAPMVNQVLAHVGNMPNRLIDFCRERDIVVEGYSPFGHGNVLGNDTIAAVARKHGVSPAQVCVAYVLARGLVTLPKASSREHMIANAQVDFVLDSDDMALLEGLVLRDYGEDVAFPCYAHA